jgi:hypothetical protein
VLGRCDPDLVGHALLADQGDLLGQGQRGALTGGEEDRLGPRRQGRQPPGALAGGDGVADVLVEAVRTAVQLGDPDADQFPQAGVEVDAAVEGVDGPVGRRGRSSDGDSGFDRGEGGAHHGDHGTTKVVH